MCPGDARHHASVYIYIYILFPKDNMTLMDPLEDRVLLEEQNLPGKKRSIQKDREMSKEVTKKRSTVSFCMNSESRQRDLFVKSK